MSQELILGLDCGQTSCKSCLVQLDGTVVAMGQGGAIEHLANPEGLARSRCSVQECLLDLRRQVGSGPLEVTLASVGFSGISPAREQYLREWIRAVFPVERIIIKPDAPVNLAGAGVIPGSRTVVVIAGGGSVAWAIGPDGNEITSGGWSHIFGDEGSGWQIGRSAVIAALRALDGRGPATMLEAAIARHFNLGDVGGIKELYYSHRIGDPDLARLVPLVAEAAINGDLVARGILAEAGTELGLAAAAVIRRLGWTAVEVEVVATGGVFKTGGILWDSFRATILAVAPRARVSRARFDPVIGAFLLGMKELGMDIPASVYENLDRSLLALSSRKQQTS